MHLPAQLQPYASVLPSSLPLLSSSGASPVIWRGPSQRHNARSACRRQPHGHVRPALRVAAASREEQQWPESYGNERPEASAVEAGMAEQGEDANWNVASDPVAAETDDGNYLFELFMSQQQQQQQATSSQGQGLLLTGSAPLDYSVDYDDEGMDDDSYDPDGSYAGMSMPGTKMVSPDTMLDLLRYDAQDEQINDDDSFDTHDEDVLHGGIDSQDLYSDAGGMHASSSSGSNGRSKQAAAAVAAAGDATGPGLSGASFAKAKGKSQAKGGGSRWAQWLDEDLYTDSPSGAGSRDGSDQSGSASEAEDHPRSADGSSSGAQDDSVGARGPANVTKARVEGRAAATSVRKQSPVSSSVPATNSYWAASTKGSNGISDTLDAMASALETLDARMAAIDGGLAVPDADEDTDPWDSPDTPGRTAPSVSVLRATGGVDEFLFPEAGLGSKTGRHVGRSLQEAEEGFTLDLEDGWGGSSRPSVAWPERSARWREERSSARARQRAKAQEDVEAHELFSAYSLTEEDSEDNEGAMYDDLDPISAVDNLYGSPQNNASGQHGRCV